VSEKDWLKQLRPFGKLIGIGMDKHELLRQFVSSLDADLAKLEGECTDDKQASNFERIRIDLVNVRKNFADDDAWSTAYKVEKQLAEFLNDERAGLEFHRRVQEAGRANAPFKDYYAALVDQNPNKATIKQALPILITDLQWFYNRQYIRQRYAKFAFQRVGLMFLVSFCTFVFTIYLFAHKLTSAGGT